MAARKSRCGGRSVMTSAREASGSAPTSAPGGRAGRNPVAQPFDQRRKRLQRRPRQCRRQAAQPARSLRVDVKTRTILRRASSPPHHLQDLQPGADRQDHVGVAPKPEGDRQRDAERVAGINDAETHLAGGDRHLQHVGELGDLRARMLRAAADDDERALRRGQQHGGGHDRVVVDATSPCHAPVCSRTSPVRPQTSIAHSRPTGRGRPVRI